MVRTACAVVSRIAYLSSNVIVDLRNPYAQRSLFSQEWSSLKLETKDEAVTIKSLPYHALSQSDLLDVNSSGLLSAVVQSQPGITNHLLPYLAAIATRPIVLHICLDEDLSDVTLLKAAIPFVLYSKGVQQAHDHALIASKLARCTSRPVLHMFHLSDTAQSQSVSELDAAQVENFVTGSSIQLTSHANRNAINGYANGHANGNANGSVSSPLSSGKSTPLELTASLNGKSLYTPSPQDALYKAYNDVSLSALSLLRRPIKSTKTTKSENAKLVIFTLG